MVATQREYNNILANAHGRKFTLLEACEFMEFIDRTFPTGCHQINWVDSETDNPIAIGYNPCPKSFKPENKDHKRKCGIPEISGKIMKRNPFVK